MAGLLIVCGSGCVAMCNIIIIIIIPLGGKGSRPHLSLAPHFGGPGVGPPKQLTSKLHYNSNY